MEARRFAVCFKDGRALSLSSLGEHQSGLGEFCCLANLDVLLSDKLGLSTAFLNCWDWDYALSKYQSWLLRLDRAVPISSATSVVRQRFIPCRSSWG